MFYVIGFGIVIVMISFCKTLQPLPYYHAIILIQHAVSERADLDLILSDDGWSPSPRNRILIRSFNNSVIPMKSLGRHCPSV